MAGDRFFVERREVAERLHSLGGATARTRDEDRGLAVGPGAGPARLHRWSPLPPGAGLAALPSALRPDAERLLSDAPFEAAPLEWIPESLDRFDMSHPDARVELRVREVRQRVLCLGDEGLVQDERRYALAELRASVERHGRSASLVRHHGFADGAALAAALGPVLDGLPELWELTARRLDAAPVADGLATVVIPPGANAGVFFHEVCGHPLEGDAVARGASCLASRFGERVAGEHVTVLDNPCRGAGALAYRVDDEGTPARPVPLVREGVVAEPLMDLEAATLLERPANGHGRRVSFRHPPLPRMAHTELAPHRGHLDEIVSGTERGLLIRGLTPRHVDLMTGDFSFYVTEAQEISGGRLRGFVGPAILRGNALAALAGIDAVGADSASFFGLGGCGKLEHGPLPVSFGNPTVRLTGLAVSPWS